MTGQSRLAANPFSTCWIRPDRCEYQFDNPDQLDQLIDNLLQAGSGQITGAHGTGKSTLLATLLKELVRRGCQVTQVQLHAGERRLAAKVHFQSVPARSWLAIDGFEQLSRWRRWRLARQCRRRQIQLLVTSHQQHRLGTSVHLAPGLENACRLVEQLQRHTRAVVTRQDVAGLFRLHKQNVREILFGCYDLFQQRTRCRK